MWVKGSGCDLATMGPEHFTGLRLDEVLPLIEREEMSDEDMVAYLARCQLDPAMPRVLDRDAAARVRPGAARPPHASGRHQRARRHGRRRAARARVLRRRRRVDPVHPPRLHALQAGRRGGPRQPGPASSSCWPSTASSCGATAPRRPTGARSRSSTRRSRSSTSAPATCRASAGRTRRRAGRARARALLHELLPAIRGAVSSERPKLLTVDTSPRTLEFVSSAEAERARDGRRARAPTTSCTPSACRCGSRTTPTTDDADALRERIAERAEAFRADYRAYVDAHGDETTRAGRPRPADRAGPAPRARLHGHDDEERRRSRATSTTARSR